MDELNTSPENEPNIVSNNPEFAPAAGTGKPLSARELRIKRMQQKRNLQQNNDWVVWLVMLPAVFLLGLGSGWLVWGRDASAAVPTAQVQINDNIKRYEISADDDPSIGPENAPITIIEFSDYQCPYCTRWYDEVYSRLLETYKDKIRFVYRDFPLYSIHPEAESAAEAANCAGEQDAYWKYHDALFGEKFGLGGDAYLKYASDLGLNTDQFGKCMSERRYQQEVKADFEYASGKGVSSTPTFFVNGMAVIGAQPFEVFQQIIDKELAGQIPK